MRLFEPSRRFRLRFESPYLYRLASPLLSLQAPPSPHLSPLFAHAFPVFPTSHRHAPGDAPPLSASPSDRYSNTFSSTERPTQVWALVFESPRLRVLGQALECSYGFSSARMSLKGSVDFVRSLLTPRTL